MADRYLVLADGAAVNTFTDPEVAEIVARSACARATVTCVQKLSAGAPAVQVWSSVAPDD